MKDIIENIILTKIRKTSHFQISTTFNLNKLEDIVKRKFDGKPCQKAIVESERNDSTPICATKECKAFLLYNGFGLGQYYQIFRNFYLLSFALSEE